MTIAPAVAVVAALCAAPSGAGATAHPAAALTSSPATRAAAVAGTSCRVFPATSIFHADISKAPVNVHSSSWLSHMQTSSRRLHPDFGPSYGAQPVPYGIPVTVVKASHATVAVRFTYASESDRRRYPLGSDTKIEGGAGAGGDRHAIVVDASTCRLYETWNTRHAAGGWTAGSGASWLLTSNALRTRGWTSADAAGLPILAGLLTYDEVKAGNVDHPIRFTTDVTARRYVWPARHQAGSTASTAYPPMGAWFRLKSSFKISGYSRDAQVVLRAMKTHGLILADNGSPWYFQGTSDTRWKGSFVDELKKVPASAFQAIDVSSMMKSVSSGAVR